jgi:hypothetical protein
MKLDAFDGAVFERCPVRGKVAVAEGGQRQMAGFGHLDGSGRLAVVLEEFDDADAGRQLDQALLEAKQQVFDQGGLGVRLLPRDLAQPQGLLLAVVTEVDAEAFLPFLDSDHRCGSIVTATLLPNCYHRVRPGLGGFAVSP